MFHNHPSHDTPKTIPKTGSTLVECLNEWEGTPTFVAFANLVVGSGRAADDSVDREGKALK